MIYEIGLGFKGSPIATFLTRLGIMIVSIFVSVYFYSDILRRHFPKVK